VQSKRGEGEFVENTARRVLMVESVKRRRRMRFKRAVEWSIGLCAIALCFLGLFHLVPSGFTLPTLVLLHISWCISLLSLSLNRKLRRALLWLTPHTTIADSVWLIEGLEYCSHPRLTKRLIELLPQLNKSDVALFPEGVLRILRHEVRKPNRDGALRAELLRTLIRAEDPMVVSICKAIQRRKPRSPADELVITIAMQTIRDR
jgi:hypothetical protein